MERLVILGSGESGVGAAILGKKKGFDVFVSDKGPIKAIYKAELVGQDIHFEEGQHTKEKILNADVIVKSPGIPDKAILVKEAKSMGISVISEIEFAFRYTRAKTIGITGSNGKTTTTNLTYHLMHTAGLKVEMGGNIGLGFARIVADKDPDWVVLELSSFQLDDIKTYRPDIGILLNITPDHLDRYDYKMANYVRSKFRIAMNQRPDDFLIYNAEDPVISENIGELNRSMQLLKIVSDDYPEGKLILNEELSFDLSKCRLKGPHNRLNALCAVKAAYLAGAGIEGIQQGLDTFINAPHRLESFAEIDGVEYINDSKATNVDSVYWALRAMEKPTVLILGGQDKGNDYAPIDALVKEKVIAIVCMGLDNEKIVQHFSPLVANIVQTNSVQEAVMKAKLMAKKGEVVLLSPACASFDLFNNYEHRGDSFKEEVLKLIL